MSNREEGGNVPAAEPPRKKHVSMTRNVLALVLLAVFATVAVWEIWANQSFVHSVNRIEMVLDEAKSTSKMNSVTLSKVNQIIGKTPDGPGKVDGWQTRITYTWRGPIRKHVLTATYQTQDRGEFILTGVETSP